MKHIKNDFPLLRAQDIAYLDNASTTQKPQAVIDAVVKTYMQFCANPGRGIYQLAELATEQYEAARKTVAHFFGAKSHEMVFVRGATEGLNFIASGTAHLLSSGDEIVLTELEHHANLVPWQRVAQKTGAVLKFIPIAENGDLDYEAVDSIIGPKTKIVSVTQSSNAIGTFVDLAPIVAAAKAAGALIAVDACQSAPHQKIDVKKLGIDFMAISGHKMFGPFGSGALYINENISDRIDPLLLGGGCVYEVTWDRYILREAPEKFEAGTPSVAQAIGFAAALDYITQNVPFDQLQKHEAQLCAQLIDGLSAHPNIKILGPLDQLRKSGHLVSFVVNGMHAHDVAALLDQQGVCVRAGHFCAQPLMQKIGYGSAVRASFYAYNSSQDVERLLSALAEL